MSSSNAVANIAPQGNLMRAESPDIGAIMERVIAVGDLAELEPFERAEYYIGVCRSIGLNPLTKPFDYISLDGKLTLYAGRGATDQLRKIYHIDIKIVDRQEIDGVYMVTARATLPDGRSDEATGAVPLVKEGGEWKTAQNGKRYFQGDGKFSKLNPSDRANAYMKAETKAKRRATLSAVGLPFLDETEIETVRSARPMYVDASTGEILESEATPAMVTATSSKDPEQATAPTRKQPAEKKTNGNEVKLSSPDQHRAIRNSMLKKGIGTDDVKAILGDDQQPRTLTFDEASEWIRYLNSATKEEIFDRIGELVSDQADAMSADEVDTIDGSYVEQSLIGVAGADRFTQ